MSWFAGFIDAYASFQIMLSLSTRLRTATVFEQLLKPTMVFLILIL